ncbi:MAG: glycoside hydrolase family 25 protein [Lachnospiraceae bacterium]|nr:glycoside hydrolase family 25 protein [Lachnospiraceae bacterium]
MGFKHFRIIAVAAAILVVAAFFVFLLKFPGSEKSPGDGESAAAVEEVTESSEEFKDIKDAGLIKAGDKIREEDKEEAGAGKEPETSGWPHVEMLLSSVNKDLKIMITNDGALVTGVPFRTEIIKDGSVLEYEDSDMDGVISATDLPGGKYKVRLKPIEGYITPENESSLTVRSSITYQTVAYIRTLIRTEDEIDVASEDTADLGEEDDGKLLNEGKIELESGTIGIDVSKYNRDIDWEKVKASGIEYAIIRLGYRGSSTGSLVEDPYYERNIKGAREAGLKTGVYFFTQALNETEAVEEASMVCALCPKEDLDLPVFLDVESAGGRGDLVAKDQRTANIRAFVETLEGKGYSAGVYANKKWLTSYINADEISDFPIWLAQYKVERPTYEGKYDAWQYSSKGHVEGIEGYVDLDLNISL